MNCTGQYYRPDRSINRTPRRSNVDASRPPPDSVEDDMMELPGVESKDKVLHDLLLFQGLISPKDYYDYFLSMIIHRISSSNFVKLPNIELPAF